MEEQVVLWGLKAEAFQGALNNIEFGILIGA